MKVRPTVARRSRRRSALLAAAATATVGLLAGCGTTPAPARPSGSSDSLSASVSKVMGFLHVVVPTSGSDRTPYLADDQGRQVVLRGVAAVGMQDTAFPGSGDGPSIFPVSTGAYDSRCPAASALSPQPPLCEVEAHRPEYEQSVAPGSGDDFAEMRSMGFDLVRLVLNWSQLEPAPGHYSAAYLDRVAQVVGWAGQQGISVILDMHQDQYSRFILPARTSSLAGLCTPAGGTDGAPAWAVFTDGKPGCAVDGVTGLNPASSAAFYEFWRNHRVAGPTGASPGPGLQDHYIGALAALADRFEDDPTVIGYELMNEPQPGSLATLPLPNLYQASAQDLYPFYRRAIEALTGVRDGLPTCPRAEPTSLASRCAYPQLAHVRRQLIFFEPLVYRDELDFSAQVSRPFTAYPNIVYAPHVYTHTFTFDTFLGYTPAKSPYPPSYDFGYQTAEAEAQAMHAAVVVTEYGANAGSDDTVLAGETTAQSDTLVSGSTLWAWKGLSASQSSCWCVRWQHSSYATNDAGGEGTGNPRSVPSPRDVLIVSRSLYLDEAWPRATAGRLLAYRDDPASGGFVMWAEDTDDALNGRPVAATEIFVPANVLALGGVRVSGPARLTAVVHLPDGDAVVLVTPTGDTGRRYRVEIGAVSPALAAAVAALAASPPQPIAEPTARALAERFLATAEASPDPTVQEHAAIVKLLSSLLLGSSDPAAAR